METEESGRARRDVGEVSGEVMIIRLGLTIRFEWISLQLHRRRLVALTSSFNIVGQWIYDSIQKKIIELRICHLMASVHLLHQGALKNG
jgi:hypothetical protein